MLGRYVRERGALPLMTAIRKMTLMPAQRLEARVRGARTKGRLSAGADADITVFDPATVLDEANTVMSASAPADGLFVRAHFAPRASRRVGHGVILRMAIISGSARALGVAAKAPDARRAVRCNRRSPSS